MAPRLLLLAASLVTFGAASGAAAGLDPAKALTQYSLDVWVTEQGLPQNTVTSLVETGDGYLWAGTYDGLARFDGVRFTVLDKETTPALKSNGVRVLCADGQGGFWIGTNGGGLSRYHDGAFTREGGAELAEATIWALARDGKDGLWIGTSEGALYHWSAGILKLVDSTASGEPINVIRADRAGSVWVGTYGEGLKRLATDGRWTRLTARDGLPSSTITSLLEDRSGNLWAGTVGGLARLTNGKPTTFSVRDGLPSAVVWDMLEDRRGTLWLATGQGLARFRDGRFEVLSTRNGLPDDVVYSLHEDREGTLWIGTNGGGLCRLRDGKFTTYTTREGLTNDYVYAVHEARDGSVWIATSSGVSRFQAGRFQTFTTKDGLGSDVVRSVHTAADGTLWVGTYGGGISRLQNGRFKTYTARDGLADDSVRAVVGDLAGGLWAGTVRGLSRYKDGAFTTFTTKDGLSRNSIIALSVDEAGTVWIGTDGGGLCRYSGSFECLGPKEGLASGVVLALRPDEDGSLWIGTSGGLCRLAGGRIVTYTTRDGLPTDAVYQILDDGRGSLWLGSSKGIARVSKQALVDHVVPLVVENLGRSDGLKSLQCTAPATPARSRDGRLWFATTKGAATLDPARRLVDTEAPPIVIEDVTVDNRSAPARGPLTLPPGTTRLAFRYTGLCLLAPDKVAFRYKLEGFDPDWIDAGERRVAYYTNLPPGTFRFQVAGRNGDGVWNTRGAAIELTLLPRFYQTLWFWPACVAAAALLGFGVHRIRVARLTASEQRLAQLVEERTHELERQKAIAEDADRMKTELLEIATHDLKNPLMVVTAYSEMLTLLAEVPRDVREKARIIFQASQRMFGLVNALLNTATLEGQVTLKKERVDLGALAAAVAEDARPMAERKEQRVAVVSDPGCIAEADEDRLRDVMDNLLNNAIKYAPRGTAVHVAVHKADGLVRFEVRDEGPGLTPDDLGKLFQRFGRAKVQTTAGEPSTGLGLSIVKRIVELHGGRVWAESPGRSLGSTFAVELPVGRPPAD